VVNPELSVVIPIYNEEENIPELYNRLMVSLKQIVGYEIIFVDDGSSDDSFSLLKDIAAENKAVKVIKFSRNFGQHPAISAAFSHARGNYIILMDADLQDDPADIISLYERIGEGYDIVFTQIVNKERSLLRKIYSLVYHFVFSKISGAKIPANIGTLRIFSRKVLKNINRYHERKILYGPLMTSIGFKCSFLSVKKHSRLKGKTHYSFAKLFQMAVDSLSTYTRIPIAFMVYFGFSIAILSFFIAILLIIKKMLYGVEVSGYTSIIVSIFFIGGSILLSLGIIGDNIYRIYQEVLNRPLFLIDEEINIDPQEETHEETKNR
jgi:polyisoprenyl-phosphate glycosyltransferase